MSTPLIQQLPPIPMHAPVEIHIVNYMRLPDGRTASITFHMPFGRIPTRLEIKEAADAMMSPESFAESSIPAGTRPLTKPEFVAHITKRETGEAIPVPGSQEWEMTPIEIPHGMLVHAIMGAGFKTMEMGEHFTQRGLAEHTGNQWNEKWGWKKDKLSALPTEVLLAIYKEVA
jgi:hypothetical protein